MHIAWNNEKKNVLSYIQVWLEEHNYDEAKWFL